MKNGSIPLFPEFTEISLGHNGQLTQALRNTPDGISEFTFSNLYLFRKRYAYKLTKYYNTLTKTEEFIFCGEREAKKFFLTPFSCPQPEIIRELFKAFDYWKNIGKSIIIQNREILEKEGIEIKEDRDNFDYLYYRTDLAALIGKKFHKKRNLVNAFLLAYPKHSSAPLNAATLKDAALVLKEWEDNSDDSGDYIAAAESLELFGEFQFEGRVVYVDGQPAAFCSGESVAGGRSFALHFEKAIGEYKGIYQFINQDFAQNLSDTYTYINREQDLGDEGLRQSKMTYRPCDFVKKHTGVLLS